MGSESLLGQGDMLYLAPGTGLPTRVHGAFVADAEVHRVVDVLKSRAAPQYVEGYSRLRKAMARAAKPARTAVSTQTRPIRYTTRRSKSF